LRLIEYELLPGRPTVRVDASGELHETADGWLVPPGRVTIHHPFSGGAFYRHGWHSWRSARWVDLDAVPDPDLMADPGEIVGGRHGGCWVGAVQGEPDAVLLLGGLGLDSRVGADTTTLVGRSEAGPVEWFVAYGPEEQVFAAYARRLAERFGARHRDPGRIWCSWYSYFSAIDEPTIHGVLDDLDALPFDVFQVDDGWQRAIGDWEPNDGFPAGMADLAARIADGGYEAGLWLAPFIARDHAQLFVDKPHLFLVDARGDLVPAGFNWGGPYFGLDLSLPEAQDVVRDTITRAVEWGYTYLKLDFIFGGALAGDRASGMPREQVYRRAVELVREAAGEQTYLLACGAPVVPSLGVFDGLRVGPDVAPFWEILSQPPTEVTLAEPATRSALSTSLARLWLKPLIAVDPDVVFFRSHSNQLDPEQRRYLCDMAAICEFVGSSDPPDWLSPEEHEALARYLHARPAVERLDRYRFRVDGRIVDYAPVVLDGPGAVALGRAGGMPQPGPAHQSIHF
jgi:alpha-galactosidase